MSEMLIRHYPLTPLTCYPYSCFENAYSHLPMDKRQERERSGGAMTWRTGNMDYDRFERLKRSIHDEGILNPVMIEYFKKEKHPLGLAVQVGNNRVCAMDILGIESGPALFIVPRSVEHLLPSDPFTDLAQDSTLLSTVRALWSEVLRAPEESHDGNLGQPDAWMGSNVLLALVRNTLPDPNLLTRQRSKNHEA